MKGALLQIHTLENTLGHISFSDANSVRSQQQANRAEDFQFRLAYLFRIVSSTFFDFRVRFFSFTFYFFVYSLVYNIRLFVCIVYIVASTFRVCVRLCLFGVSFHWGNKLHGKLEKKAKENA